MKYASDNRFVHAAYSLTTGPFKPLLILLVVVAVGAGLYFPVRDFYIAERTQDILQQQVAIREKYNKSLKKDVDQYLSKEGIEDAARKDLGMVMPGEKTITVTGLDEDGNPIVEQEEGTGDQTDQGKTDARGDGQNAAGQGQQGQGDTADGQQSDSKNGSAAAGDDRDTGSSASDNENDSAMLKGADAADKNKSAGDTGKAADADKDPETSAEVEAAEKAVFENSPWYWKMLDAIFFFDGVDGMAVVSTGDK